MKLGEIVTTAITLAYLGMAIFTFGRAAPRSSMSGAFWPLWWSWELQSR